VELAPFAASARAGLEAWMTAHVVFDALDPARPATLSPTVLQDVARRQLGFQGALLSDDLEMRAVSEGATPGELACASIAAGCDVLLVCSREDAQDEAFASLVRAAQSSSAFRTRVEEAAGRSAALRHARRRPASAEERARVLGQSAEARSLLEKLARPAAATADATASDPTEQGRT
jgi:beta-N-acetylhexosaminidase